MPITFYRADGRTLEQIQAAEGFKAWNPIATTAIVADLLSYCSGITDTLSQKLQKNIQEAMEGQKQLGDLSSKIKFTGQDRTLPFWVSTALDSDCKGQTKGASVYKFTLDVAIYQVAGKALKEISLQDALGKHNKMLDCYMPSSKPFLVLDSTNLGSSRHIALLHGQSNKTAEVSFFTTIPKSVIQKT